MSIIVEALNRLQDQVQLEEAADSLVMPSADAPQGRARWLMMGIGLVATLSIMGWLWFARPHTVVATPAPPAAKQAATPVASPTLSGPSPVVPTLIEPELKAPGPAHPASGGSPTSVRKRNAVVSAPSRAFRSSLSLTARPEEPIAFGGVQGEDAPAGKGRAAPSAAPPAVSEPAPVEIQKSTRTKTPDPAVGLFRLGVLYQQAGDHHRAMEQYRALLALDPRHVPALNNLAVSLRHLGELDKAAELLQRATAVDPAYDKAFTNLGVVRQLQERPDAAIEAHLRALAIDAKNWESALNLGLLFWEAHDLARARDFFLKVVAFRFNAAAHYYLGLIAERQGQAPEALRRYRQVIQGREGAQAELRVEAERRIQNLVGLARR